MVKAPKDLKSRYVLAGFSQDHEFRVFRFERIDTDRSRTMHEVKADLSLARKYAIRLQELPLLCLVLLEQPEGQTERMALTLTEGDMQLHASAAVRDAAAQKRRAPRRTTGQTVGAGWRGTPLARPADAQTGPDEGAAAGRTGLPQAV